MNVLFLTTHLNTGGITSYLLTLTKELSRRGFQIHIVSSGGNMQEVFSSCGAKLLCLDIRTKSELSFKVYRAVWTLRRYIRENQIDLMHAHTRVTQVAAQFLKILTARPYVTTCHGFFKTRVSRRIFPFWGDAVIAISEAVRDHLTRDFGVAPERVVLIKSGVDLEMFPHIDENARRERRKTYGFGGELLIGTIARLSEVKGQDILIRAMKIVAGEMPDVKLLIVGQGKTEVHLKAMVESLGLGDRVLFYPVVDKTFEILSMLDVFVMPSRQEGLGLSVMEAQAAGVAVAASNVGGIPSLIENGRTGVLVPSEDASELARAILDLLRDPDRRRVLGSAAREFIRRYHSSQGMAQETAEVYQRIVSATRSRKV